MDGRIAQSIAVAQARQGEHTEQHRNEGDDGAQRGKPGKCTGDDAAAGVATGRFHGKERDGTALADIDRAHNGADRQGDGQAAAVTNESVLRVAVNGRVSRA